jgi:predicted nucleotidyltransferase
MLATLLGSETRARILRLLLTREGPPFHVRELVRGAAIGSSGVQRELARLAAIGLIAIEPGTGGRRVVRLAEASPLLDPLRRLLAADEPAVAGSAVSGGDAVAAAVTARVNPHVRDRLPALVAACSRAGAERLVLFGSATEPDAGVRPHDIDLLVRLGGPDEGRGARYFSLVRELERVSGLPVDLVEDEGLANPYLRAEIERSGVVVHEAA